jgi:hypothetical protein
MNKINLVKLAMGLMMALSFVANANAADVELGWTDITPCVRTNWNQVYNASVDTTEQRLVASLHYDTTVTGSNVENYVATCAAEAAAAAGIAALTSDGIAGAPVFWGAFQECLGDQYSMLINLSLNLNSQCVGW